MKENSIENFEMLGSAISNLSDLAQSITETCVKASNIYSGQRSAWASSNSTTEADKMVDYNEEAKKIANNVFSVQEAIDKFKTTAYNIDADVSTVDQN